MTSGDNGDRQITAPTVSAGYAKELVDFAQSRGASRSTLLDRARINPADLNDPDNRLPLTGYVALMKYSQELCNDPSLALHLGAATDFKEISVVGLICYSAPTMGEALMELNRFGPLVAELDVPRLGARFQLTPSPEGLWMVDTRTDPNSFPEMTEETWSRFIAETTRHFPDMPYAKEVHVTHRAPAYRAEYEKVMKVPVIFESDKNAMLIDENWPDVTLNEPDLYIFGILSEHAAKLLASLETAKTVRGKIERLLIPNLHKSDLGMDNVAAQMGLSRQTLFRRLKAEGVTYEKLLDDLRHQMALHYLSGKKATIHETAMLVGFSDSTAFSRAFKRWTGKSPRAMRSPNNA